MDRNEILEKLAEKVKKEGQVYMPPAISVDADEYIGSLYSRIKDKKSFAYILNVNECRIILEEEPCRSDPREIWVREVEITRGDNASYGKLSCERVCGSPIKMPWLVCEVLGSKMINDGFKTLEDFLESISNPS